MKTFLTNFTAKPSDTHLAGRRQALGLDAARCAAVRDRSSRGGHRFHRTHRAHPDSAEGFALSVLHPGGSGRRRPPRPGTGSAGHRPQRRARPLPDYDRLRAMGIRDRPISPRSPWQNPYVERLIGTLRRDCLDHILIFDERHLRRVLTLYSLYYNETRTHLGLAKDAPLRRAVQRSGTIIITPILCGLHHRYARI